MYFTNVLHEFDRLDSIGRRAETKVTFEMYYCLGARFQTQPCAGSEHKYGLHLFKVQEIFRADDSG